MREMRVRLSEEGDGNEIASFSEKRMMKVRVVVPRGPLAGSRSAVSEIFSDTALLLVFLAAGQKISAMASGTFLPPKCSEGGETGRW